MSARQHLRAVRDMPLDPFGDFIAAVAHLAERDSGADGRAARDYLDAFSKRRQIVAQSIGKYELLGNLAPAIKDADGALVFTETVRAANHAINRLDPLVSVDLITGSTARRQRREILDDLRDRKLDVVAAPRVLDEGIDVPDANLGVVMSASRTRRQMIQRMGRILRRKRAGVAARFVIMFAKDTLEDPASRIERDGFLDEIERISEATGVFDLARFAELDAFLATPGPEIVPDPEHLERYDRTVAVAGVGARPRDGCRGRRRARGRARCRGHVRVTHLRPARPADGLDDVIAGLDARPAAAQCGTAVPRARARRPCRTSASRASSRSGCRPGRWRWRSRGSATRGASAAPGAGRRHRRSSSGGRSSIRPWPAAARDACPTRSRRCRKLPGRSSCARRHRRVDAMAATLTDARFSDPDWIYERKLDGERCLAWVEGGRARLRSRNDLRLDDTYPELVDALAARANCRSRRRR